MLIAFLTFPLFEKMTAWLAAIGEDVPYQTATALVTFLLLSVLLTLVGRGWLLKGR